MTEQEIDKALDDIINSEQFKRWVEQQKKETK